jgi:hypothetical protein
VLEGLICPTGARDPRPDRQPGRWRG